MYKIISKVLTNRLKRVLYRITNRSQSTLLKDSGTLYSILVANEVMNVEGEKKMIIIKVDNEKTYDSVDRQFFYYTIGRLGFCSKWIGWIRACLESSTLLVLVNESRTKELTQNRGLRQDDPIAIFLFLIIVERLVVMVRQASKNQIFQGMSMGIRVSR